MAKAVAANGVRNSPAKPAEMPVISISRGASLHVQQPPYAVGYSRAELHRHALAARAAAEEVRQPGGAHDEGHEPERYLLSVRVPDLEHHAHAVFTARAVVLICPGHQRADDAEEGQKPGRMRVPDRAQIQQRARTRASTAPTMTPVGMAAAVKIRVFFIISTSSNGKKPMLPRAAAAARRSHQLNAVPAHGRGDLIPLFLFF